MKACVWQGGEAGRRELQSGGRRREREGREREREREREKEREWLKFGLKGLGGSNRWRQGEVRRQWHYILEVAYFSRYPIGVLAIASDTRLLSTST